MRNIRFLVVLPIVAVVFMAGSSLWADDVTGADRLLCASMEATRCYFDECASGDPVEWNIPQFVVIDLVEKRIETTAASGENRATPISNLVREDGLIVIQGLEGGRAFSFVIHEASGELNAAVASADSSTVVFAACTPLPVVN
jgi:hypothetical protein